MAYVFQTFVVDQVLTAAQMNQVEANITNHVHGSGGVTDRFYTATVTGSANINGVIFNSSGSITGPSGAIPPQLLLVSSGLTFNTSSTGLIAQDLIGTEDTTITVGTINSLQIGDMVFIFVTGLISRAAAGLLWQATAYFKSQANASMMGTAQTTPIGSRDGTVNRFGLFGMTRVLSAGNLSVQVTFECPYTGTSSTHGIYHESSALNYYVWR